MTRPITARRQPAPKIGHARDRRQTGYGAGGHVGDARGVRPASRFRSFAPPTAEGVRLLPPVPGRDRGRNGTPASCTTPVAAGHEGPHPDRALDQLRARRDGTVHLRSSAGLPDLRRQRRLRIAGDGAAWSGLREVRYGYRGREPSASRARTSPIRISPSIRRKCIVCSRCVRACEEVQGTFALTIQGRGFDSMVSAGQDRAFHGIRMRVLRRLRAGLSDRHADGKVGHREGQARARRWSPPAPIAASAAASRRRCRATKSSAWCRTRTARRITATPA